jgi:hypothetical protein
LATDPKGKNTGGQAPLVHAGNPSCWGSRHQEDQSSKPARANNVW